MADDGTLHCTATSSAVVSINFRRSAMASLHATAPTLLVGSHVYFSHTSLNPFAGTAVVRTSLTGLVSRLSGDSNGEDTTGQRRGS